MSLSVQAAGEQDKLNVEESWQPDEYLSAAIFSSAVNHRFTEHPHLGPLICHGHFSHTVIRFKRSFSRSKFEREYSETVKCGLNTAI